MSAACDYRDNGECWNCGCCADPDCCDDSQRCLPISGPIRPDAAVAPAARMALTSDRGTLSTGPGGFPPLPGQPGPVASSDGS